MKKFVSFLFVLAAVSAVILTATTASESVAFQQGAIQTSSAVQVPVGINDLINIGIIAIVTAGFLFIFDKTGLDLRKFAEPVAITISSYIVIELQNVVNSIPELYDPWVNFVFKLILLVVGSVGAITIITVTKKVRLE